MKINYEVLKDWEEYTKYLPSQENDIFYSSNYHNLFADIEKSKVEAFVYFDGDNLLILPYLKRPLNKHIPNSKFNSYFDITSPYGYGGIIGKISSREILNTFFQEFNQYCLANKIVSGFFRIHPFNNLSLTDKMGEKKLVNRLIYLDLSLNLNEIFSNFKHGTRKSIRKANEANIIIKRYDSIPIEEFTDVYYSTLDKRKADDFYYFNNKFFRDLDKLLVGRHYTYIAYLGDKAISAEIVLKSDYYWHSYLGGTKPDYIKTCANSLLKYNFIKDAKLEKAKMIILGGGKNDGDGIFKYKAGFSPGSVKDFYIQCAIYNQDIYKKLILEWEINNPEQNLNTKLFQRYLQG